MARRGFGGISLVDAINRISGKVALAVNVRAFVSSGWMLRSLLSNAILTVSSAIQTIARLNDSTPSGPAGGFTYVIKDALGNLYNGTTGTLTPIATGMSTNPVSLVPFRPNTSVPPWMYIGDTSQSVSIVSTASHSALATAAGSSATWTNPANATSTTLFTTYTGGILNTLTVTASGLAIPSNATITGLGFSFHAGISAASGQLTIAPNFVGTSSQTVPVNTTVLPYSVGGNAYLWNLSLTPAILNAGFSFAVTVSRLTPNVVSLNNAVITVYYTTPSTFSCTGMVKVSSTGTVYKMGVKEPQIAPLVGIGTTTVAQYLNLPANTPPWTNISGANENYNYTGTDTQPPYPAIIQTPVAGATVSLTVIGTATVNGVNHAPDDSGPSSANYPGHFVTTPVIVLFAFTDSLGNVLAQSTSVGAPPVVGNVGSSATLTVPSGAAQLQIGINSAGGTFSSNVGSYLVQAVVSTASIPSNTALAGEVTAQVWGDSPHSGPVATYIWKNANDSGTGTARSFPASATSVNNSLIFDSTPEDGTVPVNWTTLDSSGGTVATIPLFSPALESDGYQDFNACITGSIFFPSGGTFTIQIKNKDQVMFGMGGGITSPNQPVTGTMGQTVTVINSLPLLYVSAINGSGGAVTQSFSVSVPAQGIYQFEIDWDYWYHSGRSLIVQVSPTAGAGVALLPPLPAGVRQNVSYVGVYRSSLTGAQSNPSPSTTPQFTPVLANTVQLAYSNDPQVDKVDYYRQDSGLPNFTYVATGPNDGLGGTINGVVYNTAITDELSDTGAAANPAVQYDNFEPFPSIDTPKSGYVTITAGVVTWVSGDQFNTRWLPGTVILIGSPTQQAYTLVSRPTSATTMVIPSIPDTIGSVIGQGVPYNISEPILAAQPLPYLFGPTDNINYMFGVGDPLRPGTLYWCKGSNLDSAPDTNQMDVTDPSEPLVNGCMSGGRGVLASIKRFWVIMPNFFNAEATATGTSGSTWTLQATSITRGLFYPRCLAVSGGGTIFFAVDDGIHASPGGLGSESITDNDLYPIFPHAGIPGQAVTREGVTIYPLDPTQPKAHQFSYTPGYLWVDYLGTDGLHHTLVFDEAAEGWIYDLYNVPVLTHAMNEGQSVQGFLVGCSDGTLRQMTSGGTETPTGTVLSPALGQQGWIQLQEFTAEYSSNANVTVTPIAADAGNGSIGCSPVVMPSTGGTIAKTKFLVSSNKCKLMYFKFESSDPTFKVYTEGFVCRVKSWGSTEGFKNVNPFQMVSPWFPPQGGSGGEA